MTCTLYVYFFQLFNNGIAHHFSLNEVILSGPLLSSNDFTSSSYNLDTLKNF